MGCLRRHALHGDAGPLQYHASVQRQQQPDHHLGLHLRRGGECGGTQYHWDAEGRLIWVGNGAGTLRTYVWNALGWECLHDTAGNDLGSSSLSDARITWGGKYFAWYQNGVMKFMHYNALGTSTMNLWADGTITNNVIFYPYGDTWATGPYDWNALFASLPDWDWQISLGYTHARWYPLNHERWLSPDPAGLSAVTLTDPQTWNMYAYVRNNPTTLTDPTGLYTANCNGDVKNCSKQIANFDKTLQQGLKSKNDNIRKATEAYGTLGDKNGVNVTFANVVDPKHPDVVGLTTSQAGTSGFTYDQKTMTVQQATQVTVKAGLGGTDLEDTAIHEGVHVEDRAAFVNSISGDLLNFNRSLNITVRQSEANAYGVENVFRRSIGMPTLDIQDVLACPPYSDNPYINDPLFLGLPGANSPQ